MEQEYKWRATAADLDRALLWASAHSRTQAQSIEMDATYYDTADGLLAAQKAGLRLRRQNERRVCCLKIKKEKTAGGLAVREEFECEADTIEQGIALLIQKGAPEALCQALLDKTVQPICRVCFTRVALLLQQGNAVCELALDKGKLCCENREAPLCEIELELIAGTRQDLDALAEALLGYLPLVPEPKGKLSRALALSRAKS